MNETAHKNNSCGRGEQLVGYLYGETNVAERHDFERHLTICGACQDELTAFGFVRGAVGEWHQSVARQIPVLALAGHLSSQRDGAPSPVATAHAAGRDWRRAVNSLREFFVFSPLWMQAGTITAVLLVCTLAVLGFAQVEISHVEGRLAVNFGSSQSQPQAQVAAANERVYTQQEVDQMIAQFADAREELTATRERLLSAQQRAEVLEAKSDDKPRSRVAEPGAGVTAAPKRRPKRSPRSPNFEVAREDSDLPSLLDLLGDTYDD